MLSLCKIEEFWNPICGDKRPLNWQICQIGQNLFGFQVSIGKNTIEELLDYKQKCQILSKNFSAGLSNCILREHRDNLGFFTKMWTCSLWIGRFRKKINQLGQRFFSRNILRLKIKNKSEYHIITNWTLHSVAKMLVCQKATGCVGWVIFWQLFIYS